MSLDRALELTQSPSEPPSALFAPELDVYAILPARAPSGTPPTRFADARWRLDSIPTWPAYSPRSDLIWDTIENPNWRVSAKEVALLLMQPKEAIERRLPRARRKPYPPWAMPYQRLSYWRRWFAFLQSNGHTSLATVTQTTCDGFLKTITPDSRHIAITAIRAFADYGPALTYDRYAADFRPWGDLSAKSASEQPGLGDAGNKTPPIPDRVFAPLLAACLLLVQELGPDLIAARAELARLTAIPSSRGSVRVDFDARLDDYLAAARRDQRAIPQAQRSYGRSHAIDLPMVALNISLRDQSALLRPDRWAKLTQAADELGLARTGLNTPGTRFSFSRSMISHMTRVVSTACYVVVAALSGMRSSELAAIERSAYRREVLDGGVVRYRVHSKLLKGEPPGGRREIWTVVEPVADALRLAEQLSDDNHPLNGQYFSESISELRGWVNGAGAAHGLEQIPSDWELRPRQFRRTLARELAWRPNGVIAGKIHLKHVSVATTEGYAGRRGESANAFLAEVESERRRAAEHEVRVVIEAVERGEPVAGLGARSLVAAVAALPDATTDGPQVRLRDDALVALTRARADTLHITPLVHCWFTDPERARCLRGVADKSRPIVGSCQPDLCAQATIHDKHAPIWVSGIEDLRATLKDIRVPKGERERLAAKAQRMEETIAPVVGRMQ